MNQSNRERFQIPPYKTDIAEKSGGLSLDWFNFFRSLYETLSPLGSELSGTLENNLSNQSLSGLQFDSDKISCVLIEYFCQRFHAGATKLIEGGTLRVAFNAKDSTWSVSELPGAGPNDAGISFSMSTTVPGQLLITTSNLSGAKQVSKFSWRSRILNARLSKPSGGWV